MQQEMWRRSYTGIDTVAYGVETLRVARVDLQTRCNAQVVRPRGGRCTRAVWTIKRFERIYGWRKCSQPVVQRDKRYIGLSSPQEGGRLLRTAFSRHSRTIKRPQLTPVITSLRGLQTRSSDENSVCLSVCLSNTWFVTKWKKDRSKFLYYTKRSFSLVYWEEEWFVGGGATPCTWNFGSTDPRWSEIAYFQPIFARSASAVTPSKKVQLTLIRKHALSSEPKMIIVRCL